MSRLFAHMFACAVFFALLTAEPARYTVAQEDDPEKTAAALMKDAEDSIRRGLEWLVARQRDDGSFGTGSYDGDVAVTSLAGLALMAGGSTPGRGPHGAEIDKCVDYVLAHVQESGYIIAPTSKSHGPMYGHGFATMFLAECYGMSKRPELREKLVRAVRLIVNSQNRLGGWRYHPQRDEADLSVTICQVMALRAARNAGLYVPNQTIDDSIEYVKKSQNADGGFMYMLPVGESRFPISAGGVVALYSAGVYEGDEITAGLNYLMRYLPDQDEVRRRETYYYYGQYYAVQAMWQAGGKYWSQWYPAARDELIERQNPDGSWSSPLCDHYATAMALIALQLPNNSLPIFQR